MMLTNENREIGLVVRNGFFIDGVIVWSCCGEVSETKNQKRVTSAPGSK